MEKFIAWILLGLIAGSLAKLLMPGNQKGGCLTTTVLGVIGAVIGGWISKFLTFLPQHSPGVLLPSVGSIITGTVGALLLLSIFALLSKKK
jgi:uncharacterized membrane protein YeaQ/YmgE (transglycosylase-associated protein family)